MPASSPTLHSVSSQRYARQVSLPHLGSSGQAALLAGRVLVVGAGGLGSPVISYLAAAGVGKLGILDYDRVDITNLQRQVIHNEATVGAFKSESAVRYVQSLNSEVEVLAYTVRASSENLRTILDSYDIVVDCTDNFATRYLINDAAVILKKILVWGSVYQSEGQVSVFATERGPCYRCIFPTPPIPGTVANCSVSGVLGSVCATIGSIMATEVMKIIASFGETLAGRFLSYNALENRMDNIEIKADPHCPLCSLPADARKFMNDYAAFCGELPSLTVHELINLDKESYQLIDVRTQTEFDEIRIPGASLLSSEVFSLEKLNDILEESKTVILYCKSGNRSSKCMQILLDSGHTGAKHLEGGITNWLAVTSN
jgi:adenylyltransferase/sulfurtransferase